MHLSKPTLNIFICTTSLFTFFILVSLLYFLTYHLILSIFPSYVYPKQDLLVEQISHRILQSQS